MSPQFAAKCNFQTLAFIHTSPQVLGFITFFLEVLDMVLLHMASSPLDDEIGFITVVLPMVLNLLLTRIKNFNCKTIEFLGKLTKAMFRIH